MKRKKPILTIIQATHMSLDELYEIGLFGRQKKLIKKYNEYFEVHIYSCDENDYSSELMTFHHPVLWLPKCFGWRHLIFYLWLVLKAPTMKGFIKVFGSNIPTLPIVRYLSKCPIMVTYQWDYAQQTRKNAINKGLKYHLAPLLEKLAIHSADIVLVTAHWLKERIRKNYQKKTIILPNWVDLSLVESYHVDESRESDTILYVGRLHWSKGINILIDAFAKIKEQYSSSKLIICGTGEERENLKKQIHDMQITGVKFVGPLSHLEVLKLMKRAGIFVLPTRTMEGHPKALIEAMACGMACIVTSVPGNENVILNYQTGLLVEPGSVESLSNALTTLLNKKEFCKSLARNAADKAKIYDFNKIVSQEIFVIQNFSKTIYKNKGI
jgi:glycosyltransferase involved in cell wall biosynthesis